MYDDPTGNPDGTGVEAFPSPMGSELYKTLVHRVHQEVIKPRAEGSPGLVSGRGGVAFDRAQPRGEALDGTVADDQHLGARRQGHRIGDGGEQDNYKSIHRH